MDPASVLFQYLGGYVIAFPPRAIRHAPSSDSAAALSARRLSVYVHARPSSSLLRLGTGLFIRLNVGSQIYHPQGS